MTPSIKLSHHYCKLPEGFEESALLDVLRVKLEWLSGDLLRYDTAYVNAAGDMAYYPLPPKGEYLLLLLTPRLEFSLWTTIRRATPAKEAYYRKNIGQLFDCVVEEP